MHAFHSNPSISPSPTLFLLHLLLLHLLLPPQILNPMSAVPQESLDQIFYKAATEHGFEAKEIPEAVLKQLVEITLLGPTAYNCFPMRIVFVKSAEGKEKLATALMEGNKQQTAEAPVTAIICFDTEYEEQMDVTMPFVPGAKNYFKGESHDPAMLRNGNLGGGYFILAARALGLGAGAMSGFDNAKVDELFLKDIKDGKWKSNFLVNLGYPVVAKRYPRAPRLSFEDATEYA